MWPRARRDERQSLTWRTRLRSQWRRTLEPISQVGAQHRGRRGARPARREEGEYRPYATDEQRSRTGCIAGRMPSPFVRWVLKSCATLRSWRRTLVLRSPHARQLPELRLVEQRDAMPFRAQALDL